MPRLLLLLALLSVAPRLVLGEAAGSRGQKVIDAARSQINVTVYYDGSYRKIAYPLGDVPIERGVCTDVIIRAFRAVGMDLQQLVHEDMRRAFGEYPSLWGLRAPDSNIDHRRVPNLQRYFTRKGYTQTGTSSSRSFLPGDVVTWELPGGLPHIGLVSDRGTETGIPFIIHNIGAGTREEDVLFHYKITGRYRIF